MRLERSPRTVTAGIYCIQHKSGAEYINSALNMRGKSDKDIALLRSNSHSCGALQRLWNYSGESDWRVVVFEICRSSVHRERQRHYCRQSRILLNKMRVQQSGLQNRSQTMSSIHERASIEMDRAGIGREDKAAILDVLGRFFKQFDSGGSVSVMAPVLMRLVSGAPLTPLTGDDDEWEDMSAHEGAQPGTVYQNKRASTVFKRWELITPSGDVLAADLSQGEIDQMISDGEVDSDYVYFDVSSAGTGRGGFKKIERFPYLPDPRISDPLVTLSTGKES